MWITRVAIHNPVFAAMVMVALCVLGLFSYLRLNVEQMPDVTPPAAFIDVIYPGASPEAVEREINKPLEEALNSIAGVKRITSRSFEGRGQASIEFTFNVDINRAMQELRDKVALVQSRFPRDAKAPTIARFFNDNSQPVVVMALLSAHALAARAVDAGRADRRPSGSRASTAWRRSICRAWPRARCASTSTRRGCAPMRSRRPRS